jgi:hypothetical protein
MERKEKVVERRDSLLLRLCLRLCLQATNESGRVRNNVLKKMEMAEKLWGQISLSEGAVRKK